MEPDLFQRETVVKKLNPEGLLLPVDFNERTRQLWYTQTFHADHMLGYLIYEVRAMSLVLVHIFVHPDIRRRGIGRSTVSKLVEKLERRRHIIASVPERNLVAQQFLRGCGFRATCIERGKFEDQDGYQMVLNRDHHRLAAHF